MYRVTVPTIVTNGHFNKEKTLSELKRCGADRIALAIDRELDYTFSSPENLKLLTELTEYYHDNGLEVLIWLGETFGHDGDLQIKIDYTKMKGFAGNGDIKEISAFCPLDKGFTDDFCTWIKDIAKCGPDMIMLDDDFRLSNRSGIFMCCCCDNHLNEMSMLLGEKIEASQLKKLVFRKEKNKYTDAWLKTQKQAMENFSKNIRAALDEVNPNIRLGFCACTGSWGQEGWNAAEVSRIMAGNTKPFLRTIASPYWAALGNNRLGEIVEVERGQLGKMPDGEVFVEGDTYPRPRRACSAAYLECFDMIIRADGRSDGILKYMLDYVSDADYETGYIDAMVKNKNLYKEIDKLFNGAACTGVKPYISESVYNEIGFLNRPSTSSPAFNFIFENSLPSTYENGFVNILFGENARYISMSELKNGSIIDLPAAKILMERGIDVGIKEILTELEYTQKGFADLPQEYFVDEDIYVRLSGGVMPGNVKVSEKCRIISQYVFGHTTRQTGDFEYENADGIKFRVLSFDAQKMSHEWLSSYAKRRSIVESISHLGKHLDIYPLGNYPELYIITKRKASFISVGAWNLFPDKIENMRLGTDEKIKNVRFVNCNGHIENNTIILDNVLYPYEFAGFEIEL